MLLRSSWRMLHHLLLSHGTVQAAQRTFHFAQVANFLSSFIYQIAIFILQFAMYVKNGFGVF